MSAKTLFCLLLSLVLSCSQAVAQNANDIIRLFGGIMQNAVTQAALAEWKKLPEREILCVDEALHRRGTSLQTAIRQGVAPSDGRISDIRATCRSSPGTASSAKGPTFDCTRATQPDERTICSNAELSQLDQIVVAGYDHVRATYGDQYAKSINAPLFQARQACQGDAACIKERQVQERIPHKNDCFRFAPL
jgi:uncharacterized protein